ncbi:hypothetical protein FS749_008447 [Ceratobasidium sp. UAMH 11750]|nr:hypothetical protein FS749_008447 [Ceratobasidium sp. UAMH 11750]
MARRSTDEDGYWDAISSADDDDSAHLFWVPAHLHPEIAPSEFRAFLKEHARAADAGDGAESTASTSTGTESTPFPGPARALSNSGLGRKKSMLSRQYRPSADDTDDEPQPVRRSRSSIYGGPQLTIGDLQKIDELAQDADPAKLRAVLRRSLSLNVAPSFLDKADALPDTTDEADSPIIVPRPGQILRRAARTKIRKPNLPGDGGGHRFPSTRRPTRATSASAVQSGASASDELRSESDHTAESAPELTQSVPTPVPTPGLAPPHAFEEDDWHSDRPLSYTDESTIFDAYADRRDSMTSVASDEERAAGLVPIVPATLDELIAIPPIVTPAPAPAPEPRPQHELEPEPEPEPEPQREPLLHHPSPQRHLAVPAEPAPQQRTPSPVRSHSASPASSEQHLPTHGHAPQQPPPRKEKKGGLFGMGKKGKKDKDGEKDSGFFGSLFGGGRSKKADDSASSSGGGFHGSGPAAAAALLGASKSKSPAPQQQSPGPPVQPSANGTYARYPIHVERAVYRLSHIKLANPRRPLYEQVLISNLMFWYLGVINRAQQEEKERQAEKEAAERDKKEKRSLTKSTGADSRGSGGGQGQGGGGRRAEMPVRGPQYEMQNRQMAEEYTAQQQQQPQLSRSASAPPERQYHLPNRQQRPQSTDEQFGYKPSMNGGGLPPGAMAPQNRSGGTQQLAMVSETGSYGPYPPVSRPKSAGKGSSGPSAGGSLGRRPRTAEGSMGEDDVPLDRLGGSLGRRAR